MEVYVLGKFYKPLLQQSSYQTELQASLDEIETQAARVKEEANICLQKRVGDQNSIILDTNAKSSQVLSILQKIYKDILEDPLLRRSDLGE